MVDGPSIKHIKHKPLRWCIWEKRLLYLICTKNQDPTPNRLLVKSTDDLVLLSGVGCDFWAFVCTHTEYIYSDNIQKVGPLEFLCTILKCVCSREPFFFCCMLQFSNWGTHSLPSSTRWSFFIPHDFMMRHKPRPPEPTPQGSRRIISRWLLFEICVLSVWWWWWWWCIPRIEFLLPTVNLVITANAFLPQLVTQNVSIQKWKKNKERGIFSEFIEFRPYVDLIFRLINRNYLLIWKSFFRLQFEYSYYSKRWITAV